MTLPPMAAVTGSRKWLISAKISAWSCSPWARCWSCRCTATSLAFGVGVAPCSISLSWDVGTRHY
jgi:hypothetical protein